ncbi:hypothetical protein [Micromonospora sp. 067-2]|uniref:hypothetical protein n=1 Tax=Micromonospora sp. 067-2 TaxID=2789270 RepID=UPI00397E5950
MTEHEAMTDRGSTSSMNPAECPSWCRGCGPNDPMHRGLLRTIGRERTGWISVQMLTDRFKRRDPAVKLNASRSGATESVLLSQTQIDRLIDELTYARLVMMTEGQPLEGCDEHH